MSTKKADPATESAVINTQADNTINQYCVTSAKELDVITAIAQQMTPYFFAADDLRRMICGDSILLGLTQ